MKKSVRRMVSFITAVLLVALMAVPVCAEPDETETSVYAAIKGTQITFYKYLVVEKNASIPAAEFEFSIAAGGTVTPESTGELEVFAGPDADKIVIGTEGKTTFTAGQATTDGAADDGITNSTDKKYAKNDVAVDLTEVSFTHPGVYRYIITETAQAPGSVFTNDSVATRTLDVYIQDDNGTLEVQGYVMYSGTVTKAPKTTASGSATVPANGAEPTGAEKSDKYVNSYTTYSLTAGKQVTGNQGSKDKYFKFTITLTGDVVADDNYYTVVTAGYDTTPTKTDSTSYETMTQPSDANTSADGVQIKGSTLKSGLDVYLKHGQYIKIEGIPSGAGYKVAEEAEKYTSTASSSTNTVSYSSFNAMDDVEGTLTGDKVVGFKNNKDGVIPTGILLSATPWIIIGVVVVAGIVFFAVRSRKKYDEE
ncbi:MAG: hypothetical protein IJJ74_01865 [Eubacterium sp.]|nr:hypothetical protein [Eubacterium sp.]